MTLSTKPKKKLSVKKWYFLGASFGMCLCSSPFWKDGDMAPALSLFALGAAFAFAWAIIAVREAFLDPAWLVKQRERDPMADDEIVTNLRKHRRERRKKGWKR